MAIKMMVEGMSIRAISRLTGLAQNTLLNLLLEVGPRCQRFIRQTISSIDATHVECDEIWGFIGMKERTKQRLDADEEFGDCYTFTAIDRHTKLLLTFLVGKRTPYHSQQFAYQLADAVRGQVDVSTDGYTPYRISLPLALFGRVNHGVVIKQFQNTDDEHRYSPGQVVSVRHEVGWGQPDLEDTSTSRAERHNLSIRMHVRRMTRLTNGFSKRFENHEAALSLFFAFYNWCRPHMSLQNRTPAMAAGLTDHVWTVRELLEASATQF